MRFFLSQTSGCGKGGDTGPPFRSLASASSMRSWMSGVETTLHGSMDWSRRLLLFPGSSILLSSLKLDLQFFLQTHREQGEKKTNFSHGRHFSKHFCFFFVHCFKFLTSMFVADLNPRIRNTKTVESAG
jgi:hypothetical protein